MKNKDQYCLLYSVAAHFIANQFPKEKQNDPSLYKDWIESNLDLDGMIFSSDLNDIKTLVENNPDLDLNIVVYVLNHNKPYPASDCIKIENQEVKNRINLLRITHMNGDTVNNGHYVLIKNLDHFCANSYRDENERILTNQK